MSPKGIKSRAKTTAKLLEYVKNNDKENLSKLMENEDTFLSDAICTELLVESLIHKHIQISNYILKYVFDLDSEVFDEYLEKHKPFSQVQINNLNKILDKFYICCLISV